MNLLMKDANNHQFFGDATYRCVPPTYRRYKLYVICSFNLIYKHTKVVAYILIPNETKITYLKVFEILKNNYFFNPKIFTCDFNAASNNALKKIFPNCYIINCYFHFAQAIWKKVKKYNLTEDNNIQKTRELIYNIKVLCFIKPDNIYPIFKLIKNRFNDDKYSEFFSYFEKTWNPKGRKYNMKYYPNWNYYKIINSVEFDIKHLFLTNNISEHMNKLLNEKLNRKYPTFYNWKDTILNVEKNVNLNYNELKRMDINTKIILYYINNIEKFNKSKQLLELEDIMRLNSIVIPSSQISNIFTLNEFLNNTNLSDISDDNSISDEDINDLCSEDNKDSLIEDFTINENLKNDNINHDFVYNISTCINNIKLIEFNNDLEMEINNNLKLMNNNYLINNN